MQLKPITPMQLAKALKSGKWPKGFGQLMGYKDDARQEQRFCCLGVVSKMAAGLKPQDPWKESLLGKPHDAFQSPKVEKVCPWLYKPVQYHKPTGTRTATFPFYRVLTIANDSDKGFDDVIAVLKEFSTLESKNPNALFHDLWHITDKLPSFAT